MGTFVNSGTILIDSNDGGASNVSFQQLNNTKNIQVGFFTGLVATSTVTATSLNNSGRLSVEGYQNGSYTIGPNVTVSGTTANSDLIELIGVSSVDLAGAVSGVGTINVDTSGGGGIQFGAGVGNGQQVKFAFDYSAARTIKLDDPGEFAATLAGLAVSSSPAAPINQIDLTKIVSLR